jgi:hypothetical protein
MLVLEANCWSKQVLSSTEHPQPSPQTALSTSTVVILHARCYNPTRTDNQLFNIVLSKSPVYSSRLAKYLARQTSLRTYVPANESISTHPTYISLLNPAADARKHNTWLARLNAEHGRAGSEGCERASMTPIYNVTATMDASTRHPARIHCFLRLQDAIHIHGSCVRSSSCTSRSLWVLSSSRIFSICTFVLHALFWDLAIYDITLG